MEAMQAGWRLYPVTRTGAPGCCCLCYSRLRALPCLLAAYLASALLVNCVKKRWFLLLLVAPQVSNYLSFSKEDTDEQKKAELAGVVAVGEQLWVKVRGRAKGRGQRDSALGGVCLCRMGARTCFSTGPRGCYQLATSTRWCSPSCHALAMPWCPTLGTTISLP